MKTSQLAWEIAIDSIENMRRCHAEDYAQMVESYADEPNPPSEADVDDALIRIVDSLKRLLLED